MEKLQTRQQINRFAFLAVAVYMISYMTRINFGAIVSEMERATGIGKSQLSMSLTGSFVTYGLGQILCGILGDRISPKRMIACGLCLTTGMNFLLPFCQNEWQMLGVWCVNGFAQAFMWPPLVRLMTEQLTQEDYKVVVSKVIKGSSVGTILMYLLSPVLITVSGWKSVFWFAAACGALMLGLWSWKAPAGVRVQREKAATKQSAANKILWTPLVLSIMLVIVGQGMLRDGITTWMPSYISETYHLGSAISILTGVLLPIFSIICVQLATNLYQKKLQNPLQCAGVMFGCGAACALALYFLADQSAASSVILSSALTGFMHGVNLMLICMLPPYFEKYGNISTISGVLNACTYVGSAASTYGIAVLSERVGWTQTIFLWFAVALVGSTICLLCTKTWKKKFME